MLYIILIFIIVILLIKKKDTSELAPSEKIENDIEYIKNAYQPKWMFTQNEKQAYYKLKEIAEKKDLYVFAKVRLFDLVTPTSGHPKYKSNRYRIQAKHVDFVICKNNLVAKYIIELDDSTHDTEQGKKRDLFVDNVLTNCGYRVLHTRYIKEDEINRFISE